MSTPWLEMLYGKDSPLPSRAAANGESVSTPSSTDSPNPAEEWERYQDDLEAHRETPEHNQ
jgi:hypothetical protein